MSVYLVDDDADDRMIFAQAIAEVAENCSLVNFSNGRKIIDFLRTPESRLELPDLLLLDINMPILDGLAALEIIRTEMKLYSLPIAMYSTSSLDADITKALVLGANLYITKPSSFDDLTVLLHKALSAVIQHNDDFDYSTFVMTI